MLASNTGPTSRGTPATPPWIHGHSYRKPIVFIYIKPSAAKNHWGTTRETPSHKPNSSEIASYDTINFGCMPHCCQIYMACLTLSIANQCGMLGTCKGLLLQPMAPLSQKCDWSARIRKNRALQWPTPSLICGRQLHLAPDSESSSMHLCSKQRRAQKHLGTWCSIQTK